MNSGRRIGLPGKCLAVLAAWLLLLPLPPAAAQWNRLMGRLAADGFEGSFLDALFSRPECRYDAEAMASKITSLLRNRSLDAEGHAAFLRDLYRRNYLGGVAIGRAAVFLQDKGDLLREMESLYGVQAEVVVAILLLETNLGRNTGRWVVFNRLASMAASADLEAIRPHIASSLLTADNDEFARRRCREKAEWAYGELRALLHYSGQLGRDPLSLRGSPFGAIGLCQFMPSNVLAYGIDADRDGRVDPFSLKDAIFSIANFLRAHGWRRDLEDPGRREAVFRYNHSNIYVETVLEAADKLRKARTGGRPDGKAAAD